MRLSSAKPVSSPSRADKFPTPLVMRFLRSNVGSRSRGRSRSSPMFIMRTKKNAAVINDAQQEPSSPKVTCIGQVRPRRSCKVNKNSKRTSRGSNKQVPVPVPPHPCSCSCSPSSSCFACCLPCCRFTPRFRKPRSFCWPFRKWVMFFRFGYCKKIDVRDDCSCSSSTQRGQNHVNSANSSNASDVEDNEANGGETKEDFLESSTSPPKNALLLTRCRSAPYRSSSLAGRFWDSPLGTSDNTEETEKTPNDELQEMPISPNNYGDEAVETRNSSSHDESGSKELDSSSNGGMTNEATRNIQDMRAIGIGGKPMHPLLLTRCKSEPARTGERLNTEVNYWRQRRSNTTESCLQQRQSSSNCD